MGNPLITFEPTHSQDLFAIWAGLAVLLVSVTGMVVLLRQVASGSQRNRNMLGAMLLFFVAMIAGGTALFSWWSQYKTGPVSIYTDSIATPYGSIPFSKIRNASIESMGRPSLIDQNRIRNQTRILVIEEIDGKAHLLSEKNYDINRMLGELKKAVEAQKTE